MSLAHLGVGQLAIASIFSDCFSMPDAETTKPQKSMRGIAKRYLDLLTKNFFGAKLVEDRGEVALMVGFGRGVDDNIVDVDGAEGCELLEQEVHCPLERGGGVAEAE